MSNDKAVQSGKLKREPYRRSKRFDRSCRNHGSCGYCQGNRQHSNKLREIIAKEKLIEVTSAIDLHEEEMDRLEELSYKMDELEGNFDEIPDQAP